MSSQDVKRRIREAAEAEEREFYGHRAPADWLEALAPLGTDSRKPFLEAAPWLIVVFAESYGEAEDRQINPGAWGAEGEANRRVTLVIDYRAAESGS